MESRSPSYTGRRYPVEIILALRVAVLSLPTVVPRGRGTDAAGWSSQAYADGLRRRRAAAGDKWHLDEVFVKINGVRQYLWRAVDRLEMTVRFTIWDHITGTTLPTTA